jgi:energy-coupling factor transport system permease protein
MMQIGVPYRYGFALITAIRLVPIFEQEATTVYHAQLTRGVQYDRRNLRRILLYAQQFTLPMLSSALSKVDSLAVSMEGRCFGKYSKRTYLRVISYKWFDYVALLLLLITISTVVLIHYLN